MLYLSDISDVLLQSIFKLNDDEKLSYKYYNKRITTLDITTFFFIMGLNFTIIKSCDSLIVILVT